MTKALRVCGWCGEVIQEGGTIGRPRRYCRRSHRQRAYEARRLADRRGIRPDEVLLQRSTWDGLRLALRELQRASQEVVAELDRTGDSRPGYVLAVARLSAAIEDLQEVTTEPTGRPSAMVELETGA